VEIQERVRRYQELRRIRARLVAIQREMLRALDEMEAMRRDELPSSDQRRSSPGGEWGWSWCFSRRTSPWS